MSLVLEDRIPEKDSGLDIKRILFLVLKYWYFILISLIIGLVVAYMINRYTIRIYPVSMTILIKDEPEKDNSIVDLLYNGRGFTPGKNYYNEEILLKSYPLIRKAVDSLDFNISVLKEGDIKTTEIYPIPFNIKIDSASSSSFISQQFKIRIVNQDEFEIGNDSNVYSKRFKFGKKIQRNGLVFSIGRLGLDNIGDKYIIRFLNNNNIARSYTGRLNVSWLQKGASIIELRVNGPTPSKEANFLMQLAKTYQHEDLMEKNQSASRTVSFIDEQLQTIRDSLVILETSLQEFKETNYVTGLKDEAVRYYDQMEEVSRKEAELLIHDKYLTYLKNYLKNRSNFEELTTPASVGVNNELLSSQVKSLIDLQLNKNKLKRNSSTDNPYLDELDNQISDIKEAILGTISSLSASMELALAATRSEIKSLKVQLAQLPRAEREYISLNRLFKLSENLYLILMEKKAEASITRASNTSDIAIVNPPATGGPITPQTRKNYILAIVFGLGIPLGLIILFDLLNNKIKFKEDIEKYTNIPFMGVIGHNNLNSNLIVEASPRSAIAESFRSIRSNLNFFVNDISNKIILTTSALSGEGKTFFSNNLALIHAYSGKKTLLVGADMRRPKILKDFKLKRDIGLSDYLAGERDLDQIIQKTRFVDLDIINSGTVPPNPSELLLKPSTERLFNELRKRYDYIIIDSPPVGLVTDAVILSQIADHTIYVVRQGYTPVATLNNINEMHKYEKFKSISIVFNDISVNKYGYSYGYSYGYGYGNEYGYGNGYYTETKKPKPWYKFW